MTTPDGFQDDETSPIASSLSSPPVIAKEFRVPVGTSVPTVTTPAGWYSQGGEMRWWDGYNWTEHRPPAQVPGPWSAYQAPIVMTDARTSSVEVAVAWVLTFLTIGYMLPWAIAATRGKSNSLAVGLLTFFLGWTFIGWVAALVMACTAHQVAFVQHRT